MDAHSRSPLTHDIDLLRFDPNGRGRDSIRSVCWCRCVSRALFHQEITLEHRWQSTVDTVDFGVAPQVPAGSLPFG